MTEPDPSSLISGPWGPALSVFLALFGLLGVPAALAMRRRAASPALRGLLIAIALIQVGVFLGIVVDARVLILVGYLCAILGPAGLLLVVAAGAWRYRPGRYVLAAVLLVGGGIGTATGMASLDALAELGSGLARGFADAGPGILVVGGAFGYGCVWLWTLVRYVRRTADRCVTCGRDGTQAASKATSGVARWGTWATVAAALCPLPYALIRMTWLTPWPLGFEAAALQANPGLRLFGLSLGLAAIGGSVLTFGLIRPWGEVWPRWIPVLRGRQVPAKVPTTIGLLVGATITVAGRSFVQMVLQDPVSEWWMLLMFPFPVWGPLLIAASIAYYLRRRSRCPVCGMV